MPVAQPIQFGSGAEELDVMTEQEKRTGGGKLMIATFQQRARDLNPLFDLYRKKVSP
jgi:hypothetical protein